MIEARRRTNQPLDEQHQHDPVAFARDVLRLELWWALERILEATAQHDRVAVRAGRKVSKTTGAAAAAIWWSMRGGKVLVTAPTAATLRDPFWLELETLLARLPSPPHVPIQPTTPIRMPNHGRIVGRQAAKRENLQGPSGADSLYIIEEASGVRREIVEAIEGNVAGGGKILMIGNPTLLSGPYYDAFHAPGTRYHQIHISSRESPNVTEGRVVIPGLAIPEWIEEQEERHGPESPFVQIHIDGEFPTTGANSVIPLALVDAAEARWATTTGDGPLTLGVDVARSGDDESVIQPVRGKRAYEPTGYRNQTGPSLGRHVITTATNLRQGQEPVTVNVDIIGVGASAYDYLTENAPDWLTINGINVAEAATSDGYHRLRDQIAFAVRHWLEAGGAIPHHPELRTDLIAGTYAFTTAGKYRVASKDELKETLARSPDYGDALSLAIYAPPAPPQPRIRSLE